MKIIRNKFIPFRRFEAINLFGVLFCHPDSKITPQLINHERIHTAQMLEMLVVGFYLWYTVEWLIRLLMRGNAYLNISFELPKGGRRIYPPLPSQREGEGK